MADYLPATIESVKDTLISHDMVRADELDRLLSDCRDHMANPRTISTSYLVALVRARKVL